jgi:hypothetical protein
VSDREHMLLSQIPSADALVHANTKEASVEVEDSRQDAQILIDFCIQARDQIKALIDISSRESTFLAKLSSTLLYIIYFTSFILIMFYFSKSEGVSKCFCVVENCEGCAGDYEMRKSYSSKFTSANESTQNSVSREIMFICLLYRL